MSAHVPEDVKAQRERLVSAGRADAPDPNAAAAGLDELLRGQVESWGVEGPPKRPVATRWARRGVTIAGPVALVAAWWLWQADRQPSEPAAPAPFALKTHGPPAMSGQAAAPSPHSVPEPAVTGPPAPSIETEAKPPPQPTSPAPKASPRPASDEDDALARELKLLDEARRHLPGEPQAALETLAGYARSFPQGSMRVEAEVVRIEALLKLGRRAEAEKRAAKLMAGDREGLLRERVQTLLDAAPR